MEKAQVQVFTYDEPGFERGRAHVMLAKTDILKGKVQVLRQGGENNLHSHQKSDGFWFVLSGRASFYGEGDELLAELGEMQGILVPRGFKYWFEQTGDEPLQILQVHASLPDTTASDRVDHAEQTEAMRQAIHR